MTFATSIKILKYFVFCIVIFSNQNTFYIDFLKALENIYNEF